MPGSRSTGETASTLLGNFSQPLNVGRRTEPSNPECADRGKNRMLDNPTHASPEERPIRSDLHQRSSTSDSSFPFSTCQRLPLPGVTAGERPVCGRHSPLPPSVSGNNAKQKAAASTTEPACCRPTENVQDTIGVADEGECTKRKGDSDLTASVFARLLLDEAFTDMICDVARDVIVEVCHPSIMRMVREISCWRHCRFSFDILWWQGHAELLFSSALAHTLVNLLKDERFLIGQVGSIVQSDGFIMLQLGGAQRVFCNRIPQSCGSSLHRSTYRGSRFETHATALRRLL